MILLSRCFSSPNPFLISTMKTTLRVTSPHSALIFNTSLHTRNSLSPTKLLFKSSNFNSSVLSLTFKPYSTPLFTTLFISSSDSNSFRSAENSRAAAAAAGDGESETQWTTEVGKPSISVPALARLSLSDQAFFLLAFIAWTTSLAFTSLVIAAVPMLFAMGRAATSLAKLADTAREELPSTMAAIRLSGMEISDLTIELSDLSQEIADGVNSSAKAVQAAEAGIRQIGSQAREQTRSLIEERANLPIISLQPVVVGAAKKTSRAFGHATRSLMNMISQREFTPGDEDDYGIDVVEV